MIRHRHTRRSWPWPLLLVTIPLVGLAGQSSPVGRFDAGWHPALVTGDGGSSTVAAGAGALGPVATTVPVVLAPTGSGPPVGVAPATVPEKTTPVPTAGSTAPVTASPSSTTQPTGPATSAARTQSTVAKIVSDMTAGNQGHPHGVPSSYSFYDGPELDAAQPGSDMTAATAWGVVYEAAEGSPATNTRVEVRNLRLYLWSKSRSRWIAVQASTAPTGSDYAEPQNSGFSNESSPADVRAEPDGGVSVKMQKGAWYHFWPDSGRAEIDPSDVGGAFTTFDARLVKGDPNGRDDTASARYLASAGADWWASVSAPWPANLQAFFARFSYVTPSWAAFTGTTWSAGQLRQNPPPTAG